MKLHRPATLAFALGALIAPWYASAQSAADIERAQQQSQQVIQQQQQADQLRRQQDELRERTPSGQDLGTHAATPTGGDSTVCSHIKSIALDGGELLDGASREKLTRPYVERCLTLRDINQLIADLTNYYVQRGYVTTRVYIPEQKGGSGVLLLKVVEGRVESILVKPAQSVAVWNAFPGVIGSVLNLRDIEQATDQINRLASNNAHVDIAPGTGPGESVLIVTDDLRKRWQASVGLDNSGQASTGYDTSTASFSADNMAGLNDYFNASVHSSEAGPDAQRHSEGGGLSWSVPYGYWTLSLNANALHYGSVVDGQASSFDTDGSSNSETAKLDYLAYRDQSVKWGFSGDLTLKQTWNAIAGERIAVSSADLTLLDLGTNLTWSKGGTLISANLGYTIGLDAFGSTADLPDRPLDAPRADYTKLTYGGSLLQLFDADGLPLSFQSSLTGQYSRDSLYGTEDLAIGSLYTVRGFRVDNLSGNVGAFVRNDLGMPLTLVRIFGAGMPDGEIKPYVGLDYGHIVDFGSLDGYTIGLDTRWRWVSIQLAYSHPISSPADVHKEHGWFFGRITVTY